MSNDHELTPMRDQVLKELGIAPNDANEALTQVIDGLLNQNKYKLVAALLKATDLGVLLIM